MKRALERFLWEQERYHFLKLAPGWNLVPLLIQAPVKHEKAFFMSWPLESGTTKEIGQEEEAYSRESLDEEL